MGSPSNLLCFGIICVKSQLNSSIWFVSRNLSIFNNCSVQDIDFHGAHAFISVEITNCVIELINSFFKDFPQILDVSTNQIGIYHGYLLQINVLNSIFTQCHSRKNGGAIGVLVIKNV